MKYFNIKHIFQDIALFLTSCSCLFVIQRNRILQEIKFITFTQNRIFTLRINLWVDIFKQRTDEFYFLLKKAHLALKLIFIIIIIINNTFAAEKDLIDLAISHNKNGEYYNAITEIIRYQYIYPAGKFFPSSMLIMSEAYYKGGNYNKTINILTECHEKFRNIPEGEKALYNNGYVKLIMGSPQLAYRTYCEYEYIYPGGKHKEDIMRDLCFTFTLMKDLKNAGEAVKKYEDTYSDRKYLEEIKELRRLIDDEINRPKKNVWISVLGSIIIPGFGHFYTGKYETGFLSFFSNAALIYLFYDGYRDKSKVRMLVFGLAGFSFYQYSLYSSITNVYDYNNNEAFYKTIRLKAVKEF